MKVTQVRPPGVKRVKFDTKPCCIEIHGDIDTDMATEVCAKINRLQDSVQDVIPISLVTDGGDIYSMFRIVDCMKSSVKPICTIASGLVASAGVYILAAGEKNMRYIAPNGRLMLHNASSHFEGHGSLSVREMEVDCTELKTVNNEALHTMGVNCNSRRNYFVDMLKSNGNADLYFSAQDALRHNVVDHIGVPVLETQVTVKVGLVSRQTTKRKRRRQR